eukprot:GHVS01106359.1.p1 GENE.GHVS01106359.1~~GHVS01106359.1.p1  ORF type:complete len:161 (-),score=27.63 GHVS01106359.1:230-712(-)
MCVVYVCGVCVWCMCVCCYCLSCVTTKTAVTEIARLVSSYRKSISTTTSSRCSLLLSNHQVHRISAHMPLPPTDNNELLVGQRVVYARHRGSVSEGCVGTVIGCYQLTTTGKSDKAVEVLLDEPALGGCDLEGRCGAETAPTATGPTTSTNTSCGRNRGW